MPDKTMEKINVLAPLQTEAATLAQVAEALELPPEGERQPDLQYLTAIFVSSGQNKNGAVFLGSELVKARRTITNKAVDIEHAEQNLVGQITGNVFLNRDRTTMDVEHAAGNLTPEQLDTLEMDIGISAIIHKARFPDLAQEVANGEWMVSMEAYYRDFDVKVGDMIIPREKAEEMGFDKLVGSVIQLKDGDKEMGFHLVGRVLRDILFAGVGIVKNPANPRSIIMEAAAIDEYVEEKSKSETVQVVNLADISNLEEQPTEAAAQEDDMTTLIRETVADAIKEALSPPESEEPKEEARENLNHILPGTCIHYKRYVYAQPEDQLDEPENDLTQFPLYVQPGDRESPSPGAEAAQEHWCNLFELECAARPGDATMPTCWRNVFARTVKEEITTHEDVLRRRRIQVGLVSLQALLDDARKFTQ